MQTASSSDVTPPPLVNQDAGESTALASLSLIVNHHSPMVVGVCRRMLGSTDAEDAAQAVFILFWQKASHLQSEPEIACWLHRTAQHVCRNARRSRGRRFQYEQQFAAKTSAMTSESEPAVEWNEIRQVIDEEVNRLPDQLRQAFVLFHFENRSLNEVAQLTGAKIATVGTWLQRAREKVAAMLSRRGVAIGAAQLGVVLSQCTTAEAASAGFAAATLQAVSSMSQVGLSGCGPTVAALVKSGTATGWLKPAWIVLSVATVVISFPLIVFWLVPILQSRLSPDFAGLQGKWIMTSAERNGAPVDTKTVPYVETLEISGNGFHRYQTLADGRVLEGGKGSFTIDSAPHPAAIDFFQLQGTTRGVYDLDAETLTLCVSTQGQQRPEQFVSRWQDDRILYRFKKESTR